MKKKDFYLAILKKPVTLGVFFIFLLVLIAQNSKDQKSEQIDRLDAQLRHKWQTVDSLRKSIDIYVADSLMRHPEHRYIMENQARIDSLTHANDSLLNAAYTVANKQSIMTPVQRNATVFRDFSNLPPVKNASWGYYKNRKQINEFNQRKEAVAGLENDVRRAIVDKTQTSVTILQHEIDKLLNIKDSLIIKKTR